MGQIIFDITNSANSTDSYTYNVATSLTFSPASFSIRYGDTFDLKTIAATIHYQDGTSSPLDWVKLSVATVNGPVLVDSNMLVSLPSNSTASGSIELVHEEGTTTLNGSIAYTAEAVLKPKLTGPSDHRFQVKAGSIVLYGEDLSGTTQVKFFKSNDLTNPINVPVIAKTDDSLTLNISGLQEGSGNFIAITPDGNSNLYPADLMAELAITSIEPNPVITDSEFAINGEFFGAAKGSLSINDRDISVNIRTWTNTKIIVVATLDMVGDNLIKVTSASGVSSGPTRLVVKISDRYKPEITSVDPVVQGILPFQLKIYGYNLLALDKVYIGNIELTVLNTSCQSLDAVGHALSSVIITCTVPSGTTTGPVRVKCDLGVAVGPIVEIQQPALTKVTPANIVINSAHVGPYNFIVEGNWLATSGKWTVNGVNVGATSGSIKNRFALAVASEIIAVGTAKIEYTRNGVTASIDVPITAPVVDEDMTPKLSSCTVGAYNQEVTVGAIHTSLSSCKLLLNNKEIAVTSWLTQVNPTESNPYGYDEIKFLVNDTVEAGTLVLEYTENGAKKYSNVLPFTILKPAITAISIDNGIAGDEVVLTTTNAFGPKPSSKVYLGKVLCPVVAWTNTSVRIKIPEFAETGSLYIETRNGNSNCFKFTVNVLSEKDPLITDLSVTEAYAGDTVAINGRDFGSRMGIVHLGDLKCVVPVWTDKQISFIVPEMASTSNVRIIPYSYGWDVVGPALEILEKSALTEYRKNAFNPFITQCSPSPIINGEEAIVTGLNFDNGCTAKLGKTDVPVTFVSRNTIKIEVPVANIESILTVTSSKGLVSNSKQLKLNTGAPTITGVGKNLFIGSVAEIVGNDFGSIDILGDYGVYFGDGPYSKAAASSIKTWSSNKITVLLAPNVDYSYGKVYVVCNGVKSNFYDIDVQGESTAPTAVPSLGYLANGYSLKSDAGINFEALGDVAPGSPEIANLSAEKIGDHSWSDLVNLIQNGSASQQVTISGVTPDRTGNIKLRGINGVTVVTRADDTPGTVTIKGMTNEDLLIDASSSKLSMSYCDTFGVCRLDDGSTVKTTTKDMVKSITEGPGIKITRYTLSGDLFINGVNVGKEIVVLSPKFEDTAFGVKKGNHTHGGNSTARYYISQEAKDFYSGAINKNIDVFGIEVTPENYKDFESQAEVDKPAIYKVYPSKAPSGALVGIIGNNFTHASKVKIGDTEITPVYMSSNELNFTVPSDICLGNITVTDGADTSNAMSFTHIFAWTDPVLRSTVTPVKALHYKEILDNLKIKLSKAQKSLPAIEPVQKGRGIAALDLYRLRHAVNAYDQAVTWSDSEIVAATLISGVHIKELRWAINSLRFADTPTIVNNDTYANMALELDVVYHNFIDSYPNQDSYSIYYDAIADGYVTET